MATLWTRATASGHDVAGRAVLADRIAAMFALAEVPAEFDECYFFTTTVTGFFSWCAHSYLVLVLDALRNDPPNDRTQPPPPMTTNAETRQGSNDVTRSWRSSWRRLAAVIYSDLYSLKAGELTLVYLLLTVH